MSAVSAMIKLYLCFSMIFAVCNASEHFELGHSEVAHQINSPDDHADEDHCVAKQLKSSRFESKPKLEIFSIERCLFVMAVREETSFQYKLQYADTFHALSNLYLPSRLNSHSSVVFLI